LSFRLGWPFSARGFALFVTALLAVAGRAGAAEFDGLFAGADDFGDAGLMQTPTARMRADGEFGFGIAAVHPYNQAQVFLQALPWLEMVGRYTDVTDVPYEVGQTGPSPVGGEHYKDKSADFKVRLLKEGEFWPSLALGVQDFGGTGLFSSQFIVSSFHWYDLDFSFGLAWGRMGSGGSIHNPLSLFSHHFDNNPYAQSVTAGGLGLNRLFTGTIGPFSGVEWKTPVKGLALRLEYDGNDYQHEAFGYNLRQNSRINEGLAYRGLRDVDVGIAFERGNTVMARIAFHTNFQSLWRVAKTADPAPAEFPPSPPPASGVPAAKAPEPSDTAPGPPAAVSPADPLPDLTPVVPAAPPADPKPAPPSPPAPLAQPGVSAEQRDAFVLRLRAALKQQGFTLIALDYDSFSKQVRVWLSNDTYRNPAKAIGRSARAVAATAPAEVSKFTLIFVEQGLESYRAQIDRRDFETAARTNAPDAALSAITLTGPGKGLSSANYLDATRLPRFNWDTAPSIRQSVGAPGDFYAAQLYWGLGATLALNDHLRFTAAADFNIVNNFNKLPNDPSSSLPHVRSDVVQYLQQGSDGITNLEADYTWSPHPDWYHRLSLGIFEWMYGGAATELLYRPYGKPWAVAVDINRVKKRGFDDMFDFLPYTVTTGHVELYYQTNYYNVLIKLIAGKYLAGDHGATLDVSRQFDSGIRVGVFATRTNVSAAEFGEGSFDKGVYISVPLDLFFAQSTRRELGITFRPLTRDGGQMVYDGPELYSTVQGAEPDDVARGASELLN
jgi:hypothetical protein